MNDPQDLLQALLATEEKIGTLVANYAITEPEIEDAGAWRLVDVVSHLAYVESPYLRRLKRVVDEDEPYVLYIHPALLVLDGDSVVDVLREFGRVRGVTVAYLGSLPAGDWQRTAIHETWGKVTLTQLTQALIDHDQEHINQIKTRLTQ